MRLRHLPCLTLLAGFTAVAPAQAFDDLLRAVGALPPVVEQPLAFTYVAPHGGFALGNGTSFGRVDDAQLTRALVFAEKDELTGVDFGAVNGVLSLGVPPQTTTILFGKPGFAADAPEALLARGFMEAEDGFVRTFSHGDDYAVDMAAAREPDPFGSGLGKSQRLALGEDFLIRTAGWPEMGTAVQNFEEPPAYTNVWADTILAIENEAGIDAELEIASGWTMFAFGAADPLDALGSASGGKVKIKTPDVEPSLVFPFAVIALTRNDETGAIHIAIPYSDPEMAQEAGDIIASRLTELPITVGTPEVFVVPARDVEDSVPVMVLTLHTPLNSLGDVQALYSRWMGAIYQRDFQPLMSGA